MKDLKIKNNNVILYNFLIKKISIWDSSFGHNLTYYLYFEGCLNFPTLLYTSFTVQCSQSNKQHMEASNEHNLKVNIMPIQSFIVKHWDRRGM